MICTLFNIGVLLFACTITVNQGKPHGIQQGPCVGMDCLHGVLMHNDAGQGDVHKAEDQYLRFKAELETGRTAPGPMDAGKQFHGALMHGDTENGIQHMEAQEMLPKAKTKAGPVDQNKFIHEGMHGEEGSHKHVMDTKADENKQPSTIDSEQLMHGILMHGDANHKHETEDTSSKSSGTNPVTGPNSNMLHGVLMHGDSEMGHDHSQEHTQNKDEVFKDFSNILDLGLDEDLLKMIDIDKLKKDKDEYRNWMKKNSKLHDNSMGSTYATVSDSLLNDIEIMKRRYLMKSEDIIVQKEDTPFTAEDANINLDYGSQAVEGEDMRHDLELLGSTEPLNSRHKH